MAPLAVSVLGTVGTDLFIVCPQRSSNTVHCPLFIVCPQRPRVGLDSARWGSENARMEIPGRIHNGVVVLEGSPSLPEGAAVTVTYPVPGGAARDVPKTRIQVPLVRTGQPGTVNLTGERIAEILDEEDASPRC